MPVTLECDVAVVTLAVTTYWLEQDTVLPAGNEVTSLETPLAERWIDTTTGYTDTCVYGPRSPDCVSDSGESAELIPCFTFPVLHTLRLRLPLRHVPLSDN